MDLERSAGDLRASDARRKLPDNPIDRSQVDRYFRMSDQIQKTPLGRSDSLLHYFAEKPEYQDSFDALAQLNAIFLEREEPETAIREGSILFHSYINAQTKEIDLVSDLIFPNPKEREVLLRCALENIHRLSENVLSSPSREKKETLASYWYYTVAFLHPFTDGNGREARYLYLKLAPDFDHLFQNDVERIQAADKMLKDEQRKHLDIVKQILLDAMYDHIGLSLKSQYTFNRDGLIDHSSTPILKRGKEFYIGFDDHILSFLAVYVSVKKLGLEKQYIHTEPNGRMFALIEEVSSHQELVDEINSALVSLRSQLFSSIIDRACTPDWDKEIIHSGAVKPISLRTHLRQSITRDTQRYFASRLKEYR